MSGSGFTIRATGKRYSSLNTVSLLHSGEKFFTALETLIRGAQEEILIQIYIFESDSTGTRIAEALMEAALRGVRIDILIDAFGSQGLARGLEKEMTDAGILIRKFGKLYSRGRIHIGRRLHRKVILIDGITGIVGGLNFSDNYNDLPGRKAWLDFAILVSGQVCRQLRQICLARLNPRNRKHLPRKLNVKSNLSAIQVEANTRIRASQNDFIRRKKEVTGTYASAIRECNESLVIVGGYFLPGGKFRRLIRNAIKRGVKISVLVSAKSDVPLVIHARRYLYEWMIRNGIQIYEYIPSNVHGKVLIADSKFVTIGSYDLNNLSTYSNIELNLDIEDESFATSVLKEVEKIMGSQSKLVIKDEFLRKHTWKNRLTEWLAYRFVKTLFVLSIWLARRRETDY